MDLTKMAHLWDSNFLHVVLFSFIIHTDNCHFVGTEIRGLDPPRKPRKLVHHENKAIHSNLSKEWSWYTKDLSVILQICIFVTFRLCLKSYSVPYANNFYDTSVIFSNLIITYREPFTGPS